MTHEETLAHLALHGFMEVPEWAAEAVAGWLTNHPEMSVAKEQWHAACKAAGRPVGGAREDGMLGGQLYMQTKLRSA